MHSIFHYMTRFKLDSDQSETDRKEFRRLLTNERLSVKSISGSQRRGKDSLKLSLHQRYRRYEVVSSLDPVIPRREEDHPPVHGNTPVHVLPVDRGLWREEGENEYGD